MSEIHWKKPDLCSSNALHTITKWNSVSTSLRTVQFAGPKVIRMRFSGVDSGLFPLVEEGILLGGLQ